MSIVAGKTASLFAPTIKQQSRDLGHNSIVVKRLSCGAEVEVHGIESGIKILTFVSGPDNTRVCIGRRVLTEKDLTGG